MPSSSRFPLFLLGAAALVTAAALSACKQQEAAPANQAQSTAVERPAIPKPEPPLDRAAMLSAVAEAASAAAAGAGQPGSVASLDGKQFEIRIRFGCRGEAADLSKAWLGWSFDEDKRTLRVQAKPTISKDDPLVAELAGETYEAVEGFWIPRPWLLQAVCPAAAIERDVSVQDEDGPPAGSAGAGEPVPAAPRIGIAQFFSSDDPRTRRRGSRPYSTVKTLPEGEGLSSQGYNLVLSGRFRSLGERGVAQCVSKTADSPPECVVSVEFLRVRIERPDTGEMVAEWGSV